MNTGGDWRKPRLLPCCSGRARRSGTTAITVFSMACVFWSGCTSKVTVQDTLESAQERKIVGWMPPEGAGIRWVTDFEEARRTGTLIVHLEREEVPVFQVRNAVVRRETISRPYQAPKATEEQTTLAQVFAIIVIPVALVLLPVIGVLILCQAMPDSHYGSPTSTVERVPLAEGTVVGDTSTRVWRGIRLLRVSCTWGKDTRSGYETDSEGMVSVDLASWCKEAARNGDAMVLTFRAELEGSSEHSVLISKDDVARISQMRR